jgi:hypothetical protein
MSNIHSIFGYRYVCFLCVPTKYGVILQSDSHGLRISLMMIGNITPMEPGR